MTNPNLFPDVILCLWQYQDPTFLPANHFNAWQLVHTIAMDFYGHVLNQPEGFDTRGRHPQDAWMCSRDEDELQPIPGRMVTSWGFQCGVRLLRFNAPGAVPWLEYSFDDKITDLENWQALLSGGSWISAGTAYAARKLLTNWPTEEPT